MSGPRIARIIGGAGTGKTTALLELMAKVLDHGVRDPSDIGFVSFTREARRVAVERAAEQFGIQPATLENEGWFKTLHAVCYRCLDIKSDQMITDHVGDRNWLSEQIELPVSGTGDPLAEDSPGPETEEREAADVALSLWDYSRNRMEPYYGAWARLNLYADTPTLEFCRNVVERYELAKQVDHRCDFTDLLARFAGKRLTPDGPEDTEPEGDTPGLPVWFFDEQQDTSRLLDTVCRRLIEHAQWVYVVGDEFQAIYSWAGADGRLFKAWDAERERILPKSYRCPKPIHELGERILKGGCGDDYWDRGIEPADHPGTVDFVQLRRNLISDIDPRESWLLLARTNWHVGRIKGVLNDAGVPWIPTKGGGAWSIPSKGVALKCLYSLEAGEPVDGEQWREALKIIPAKHNGEALLNRGIKSQWRTPDFDAADRYPWLQNSTLDQVGATPALVELIKSGQWKQVAKGASRFTDAVELWGEDIVFNPRVRVGTIHSVKGAEADNVLLLTRTSERCARSAETKEGRSEEARVAYVAVTRARRNLIVASERTRHMMEIPE